MALVVGLVAPAGSQPAHADSSSVVISEILYKPLVGDGEFIEITNAGTTPVDLSGWTVSDGIEVTIASGTILGAGQRAVFAKISPTSRRITVFRRQEPSRPGRCRTAPTHSC